MTATVQIVISAQDRASSVVAGVEKSFVSMGTRLKTAGHNILTGIFAEQTVITRTAHLFDQKMHTAFAPVIASLFLAGDLIQPFGGAITGALQRVAKTAPVMAASRALGSASGAVQAEAQALAATGTAAVSGMATRIAAMRVPLAAEGTTVGGALGTALGVGAGVAIGFELDKIWNEKITELHTKMGELKTALVADQKTAVAAAASPWGDLSNTIGIALSTIPTTFTQELGNDLQGANAIVDAAAGEMAATLPRVIGDALASPFDISPLLSHLKQAGIDARAVWDKSAQALTGDLASALQNTDPIKTAMDKVTWALQHPMELAAQEAKIQGALATLEYKRGLASNTDEVNTVIDQQIAYLEGQWTLLSGVAYTKGSNAANNFENGLATMHPPTWTIGGGRGGINPATGKPWGARASGGPVNAGETYLVGERGPELLHMGGNGYVQAGAGSGHAQVGGGHGHTIVMDGRVVAQLIDERFGKKLAMASSSAYTRG